MTQAALEIQHSAFGIRNHEFVAGFGIPQHDRQNSTVKEGWPSTDGGVVAAVWCSGGFTPRDL
ncbi:MAG: hypothetical protein ACLQVL_34370 [Terriglobia bacterium]